MKKRFIFDENYIKRYAKKDKMRWLIIGVSLLILIIIIIIVILANRGEDKPPVTPALPAFELKENITLESGSELPEVADYFTKLENVDINDIELVYPEEFEVSYDISLCSTEVIEEIEKLVDFDPGDYECAETILKTPNTYGITVKLLEEEHTVNLVIEDTTPPVILTSNVEIYYGEKYELDDFVKLCFDINDECEIVYYAKDVNAEGNVIDYSSITEVGMHTVKLIGIDKYKNVSEPIEAELKIIEPEATLYTITFNSNGGTAVESVLIEEGKTVVEPVAPTREGYNFLGWYLGNTKYDFTTLITKNVILIAKWEKIQENNESGGNNSGGNVTPGVINVSRISLNYKKIYVYINDSKIVTANIYPANATNKSVTWKSADTNIAKVQNGKITGVKAGTTTVTATVGGKTASVTVVVKEKSAGTSCKYGDAAYPTKYTLSVNLIKNNCAVNPNLSYNEASIVANKDYQSLINDLTTMGLSIQANYFSYKADYAKIKNNSGIGLVGYQITVTISVIDPANPYIVMSAQYVIKADGTRQFISNNIVKNNVKFG